MSTQFLLYFLPKKNGGRAMRMMGCGWKLPAALTGIFFGVQTNVVTSSQTDQIVVGQRIEPG
jgi:hypothetical protein